MAQATGMGTRMTMVTDSATTTAMVMAFPIAMVQEAAMVLGAAMVLLARMKEAESRDQEKGEARAWPLPKA